MSKITDLVYSALPRSIREQLLRGKISQGAVNNSFIYDDNGMFKRLKAKKYSASGQDIFVYHMVFGAKNTGFFLDIGANDPVKINNTYLLEENGWKGFAFEPITALSDKWKTSRTTECFNIAIGDSEGEVSFAESKDSVFSGVSNVSKGKSVIKVPQTRLTTFLEEKGVSKVDVAFIDVEGYEMNVLAGIDFNKTDITCFCIENNREGTLKPSMDLRNYLIDRGYRLVARLTIDDIFIKNEYFK